MYKPDQPVLFCRQSLIANKGNLEVKFENTSDQDSGAVFYVDGGQNMNKQVTFKIRNQGQPVTLKSCQHFYFYDSRTVDLSDFQSSRTIRCRGKQV